MKKKILICGATGFIGRNMLEHFIKNDNFDSSLINIDNLIKSSKPSPLGWADVIKTAIQKIKT